MTKLIEVFKRLPAEVRYAIIWAVACLGLLLCRNLFPKGLFLPMLIGVSALILVFYLARRLIQVYEKKQSLRLDREITTQESGQPSRIEIVSKEKDFKQKWLQGVQKLKQAKISLYHLPWYIILGEPGGGKTMTLLNSGMDFPMGKEELPGFGGTRNYNWWFTNSAVILDTAGRLVFEQEGTTDRAEWEAFLKMLRRRRRCPINGVIVALPADKLISDDPEHRYQNACIIRDRLRQIQTQLDVRFPVFLLLTKSDLVAGFTEFYNDLDSLQRNQLFGWSRPGDFSAPYEPRDFNQHFEELYRRVHDMRLQFLARTTGDMETGWIYTFPEAFRALKERIQDYIDVIFSKNIFAEPLFFRGFYFTSALQEGKPIIDILGEHLSGEELENLEGIFPQSRAFFIHDFYTDKVAKEQGMVFRSQRHIKRMRLLKNSTLYVGLPLLVLFLLGTFLAYRSYNRTVRGPRSTVAQAQALIEQHSPSGDAEAVWFKTVASEDRADIEQAVELSGVLAEASEQVGHPSGLAALMFASIGRDVDHSIRHIRRELIGYCVLRPEIARVEEALTSNSVALTPANLEAFKESFTVYASWCFGTRRGTLRKLRSILPESTMLVPGADRQIEWLLEEAAEGRADLTAGLTRNRQHQHVVLESALEKAKAYFESMCDVDRHASYAWWSEVMAAAGAAAQRYGQLLDDRRAFSKARSREEFEALSARWLNLLGAPQDAAAPAPGRSAYKLFQTVEDLLLQAGDAGENIKSPENIARQNQRILEGFCRACLAAVPRSTAGPQGRFAAALRDDIESFAESMKGRLTEAGAAYRSKMRQLDQVLETVSPQGPQLRLQPAAINVQSTLAELARVLARASSKEGDPLIDAWTKSLRDLLDGPDQPTPGPADLDPAWQPDELQNLVEAVHSARQYYDMLMLLEQIQDALDPVSELGLAAYMDAQDERARVLQFVDLKNRHAASFVFKTLRAQEQLQEALEQAVRADLLLDDAGLRRALDRNMEQYLQHYVASWEQAYRSYRLEAAEDLDVPRDWNDYRRLLRQAGDDLWKDYHDHLDAVLGNAVFLFNMNAAAPGPAADDKRDLQPYLEVISWPRGSLLKPLCAAFAQAGERPNLRVLRREWKKYEDHVDEFRFETLGDLKRRPVVFPRLGSGLDPTLQSEWFTSQLQYVIDVGAWALWAGIFGNLEHDLQQVYGSERPFIFPGGTFAVEPLQLKNTLAQLDSIKQYYDRQAERAVQSPGIDKFLAATDQWSQFLRRESYRVELSGVPADQVRSELRGPGEYYAELALELPGMESGEGGARQLPAFAVSRPSGMRAYRWRPTDGLLKISLWGITQKSKGLGAEMKPRVLELPARYGLLELIRQHGQPDQDGAWLVLLSKDMTTITGLRDEALDSPTCWIAFKVRFVDPASGLPEPLVWPDLQELLGPPPVFPGG